MQLAKPHNEEIERRLLACLIYDQQTLDDIGDLCPDDFYSPRNAEIFRSIINLKEAGSAIDITTLTEELKLDNRSDKVGGYNYILELTNIIPITSSVPTYSKNLRNLSHRRRIIDECLLVAEEMVNVNPNELEKKIHEVGDRLQLVTTVNTDSDSCKSLREVLVETVQQISDCHAGADGTASIKTGFTGLDRMTSIRNGDFVIVAGRPSMGKTAFVTKVLLNAAEKNYTTLLFSLEMARSGIGVRILSGQTAINSMHLLSGNVGADGWTLLAEASNRLAKYPMWIDDKPGINLRYMYNVCHKKFKKCGQLVIAVDYMQLMSSTSRASREQQIAEISRTLKAMAREFGVVIGLSQLNRSLENQSNKRPNMSTLRESGAIEQDADTILFIYRDEVYNHDSKDIGIAEIIIGKQRQGPTGTVKVRFINDTTTFADLMNEDEPKNDYEYHNYNDID